MSAINTSALALLRRALSPSAALYLPGDAGYSVKRWALNTERPATVVAHPANVQDIVHLLAFAQGKAPYETQSALPFTVKGGAHWFSQDATSNQNHAMVIELNPKMKNVRVDTEAKVAYVEGGCLWADVDEATLKHGLASVAGTVSHVGVGGSTLGGGFGWLTGQHGLVVDNLVEATVVTSTGDVLTASESDNADLFWAIRGGGGNFGVVTEFVIRLHDQRADVYTSTLTFSPSMVEKIVPELNAWLVEREPSENAHLMFVPGANGQPELVLQLVYNGHSATGAKKFERFFELGPTAARSETIPYGRLNYLQDHHMAAGLNRFIHGNFMPSTTAGVPTTLLSGMFQAWTKFATSNPAAAGSVMILELYHTDKWASVPADATAYANRQPTFNIAYIMSWADPAFTRLAVEETFALDQTITTLRESHFSGHQGGAYTNYVGSANKFTAHQFGDNVARLEAVKTKYDPAGAFGKWFAVSPEEQDTSCTLKRAELVCAN